MEPERDVELLASESLHRGPIFEVRHEKIRLPSGLVQELDVIGHGGAVCVAALDADERLLCVRQYRHAAARWLVEIPAGRLELGEDPLAAARRELEEETGYRAREWELLTRFFPAPGFCSEWMHLFVARGLEELSGGGLPADPDEEIEVLWLTLGQALETFADAKSLVAAGLLAARGTTR